MIAWAGMERYKLGMGFADDPQRVSFEPRLVGIMFLWAGMGRFKLGIGMGGSSASFKP